VAITYGSVVTGFDAVRVGRGMPRAPVPFCGCGGTPHGRGSFGERTVSGGRLSGRGKGIAREMKAGLPGFPHSGKERARTKGESGMARVPSQ
jgi:hypothetical protein